MWNLKSERNQIDAATPTVEADPTSDPVELAHAARDIASEGVEEAAVAVLASIPPVKLGRTIYRVVSGSRSYGLDLVGPRGGTSCLVRNLKDPNLWAHNVMSGYRCKSTWYKREADGTFTRI